MTPSRFGLFLAVVQGGQGAEALLVTQILLGRDQRLGGEEFGFSLRVEVEAQEHATERETRVPRLRDLLRSLALGGAAATTSPARYRWTSIPSPFAVS